jgi:muramoyltetrapeptide carboxypeptidase
VVWYEFIPNDKKHNMTSLPLKSGDTIGVFAPSSYVDADDLQEGITFLEKNGFNVLIHPQTFKRHNQSAGTHEEKLQALYELYTNPEIKAIIAARGGNRALHLLDRIDFNILKNNPKPLIGFSDSTALLNAFWVKTGHKQIHGPLLKYLKNDQPGNDLVKILKGKGIHYEFKDVKVLKEGTAEGPILGGNTSVFQHLAGTEFMPDFTRAILLLEDIYEEYTWFDRRLNYLRQLGIFEKISGLIIGSMTNLQDTGMPFGFTLEEIIREHTDSYDMPVVYNAPFGHCDPNYPLLIGETVYFQALEGELKIYNKF